MSNSLYRAESLPRSGARMPRRRCALHSLNGNANPLFVDGRALRLVDGLRALACRR
jgi:prepilin-type processing-associated H-X9-DG protein